MKSFLFTLLFPLLTLVVVPIPSLALAVNRESLTTLAQREAFRRDGFVIVSGLLDGPEMDDLVKAGEMIVQGTDPSQHSPFFDSLQKGVALNGPTGLSLQDDALSTVVQGFRNVAMYSKLPQFAAELMGLTSIDSSSDNNENGQDNTNLRLLRDVFLAKGLESPKSCQWHVDDPSFWPESYQSTGGEGINIWIAMVDMPQGGSMGLLPGSHRAPWRHRAYEAIGQDHDSRGETLEEQLGGLSKGRSTCAIDVRDEELYQIMENSAIFPTMKRGDIIFHTRMLFHKTLKLTDEAKEYYSQQGLSTLNRYSVRYVPGKATLPNGFVDELSVYYSPDNAGQVLDDVVANGRPWYPRVWPTLEDGFEEAVEEMKETVLPKANAEAAAATTEFIKRFRAMKASEEKQS